MKNLMTVLILAMILAACDADEPKAAKFSLTVESVAFDYQPNGDPLANIPNDPYSGFQVVFRVTGGGLGWAVDEKSVTVPNAGSATFTEAFEIEKRGWESCTDIQTLGYGSVLTGYFFPASVDGADANPLGFSILAASPGAENVSNGPHLAQYAVGGTITKRKSGIPYSVESLPTGVRIVIDGVASFHAAP